EHAGQVDGLVGCLEAPHTELDRLGSGLRAARQVLPSWCFAARVGEDPGQRAPYGVEEQRYLLCTEGTREAVPGGAVAGREDDGSAPEPLAQEGLEFRRAGHVEREGIAPRAGSSDQVGERLRQRLQAGAGLRLDPQGVVG